MIGSTCQDRKPVDWVRNQLKNTVDPSNGNKDSLMFIYNKLILTESVNKIRDCNLI